jgi:hypothetical protein
MITNCAFDHDEDHDFTKDFTASIDQDYITLFIYHKGQDFDRETAGKKGFASDRRALPIQLRRQPYVQNISNDERKNIILKLEYSPVKRFPSEQMYQTINRSTVLRVSAGPGTPDTLMTHEPVANGEYADVVGEFKGLGINNLSEEDMNTLTQDLEEILLKIASNNKDSKLWATKQIERRKKIKTERAEKERNDTPIRDKEGKLIPQIGLSKYEQSTGPKRRRGTLVIMVANGEDADHFEAAYEAFAARKTVTAELENSTITLSMATKEDKAKRGMLITQKENEIQDNINVITENRNQFKTIAYKGYAHGTISNYRKETNGFLASTQRSKGKVTGIEHHTTNTSNGDMEIYIITVSSPKDRDLILGLLLRSRRVRSRRKPSLLCLRLKSAKQGCS